MPRKFTSGRCVHCLQFFEELTSDHLFPKSWYPKTTPGDLEKWQIPSCKDCNKKYGKIEQDLLVRFGLCLDKRKEGASGISELALRSMNPDAGKSPKDSEHRQKLRHKILQEAFKGAEIPQQAILPGFGPKKEQSMEGAIGVIIGVDELQVLGEKLIRGLTYITSSNYIEDDHAIDILFDPNQGAPISELAGRFGAKYHRGPGINILYGTAHDDPISGVFEITIWDTFRFYAVVNTKKNN